MRDEITDELLGAYLDGEASPADIELIEQLAKTDPDLQERISALRKVNEQVYASITALGQRTGDDPLPDLIRRQTGNRNIWHKRLRWPVPLAAGLLLGLLLALNLRNDVPRAVWHDDVAAFHDLYSVQGLTMPMALDVTERSKLQPTAKTLLGERVVIPKFGDSGYSFHGARIKANSHGTVLLVLFKNSSRHWVTLGIRKRTEFGAGEHEYAAWENQHHQYSLHGGSGDEDIASLFNWAQQQTIQ